MADDTAVIHTSETTTATVDAPADLGDAGKQALDRMKAERNEAAKQLKALQKEMEGLRAASLSETEKAIEAARAEGRTEGLTAGGKRLVKAEFRAAAATSGLDAATVTELLDDLDLSRFLTADGEPDEDAIAKAVARFAALRGEPTTSRPSGDVDQGVRSTPLALNGDPLLDSLKNKLGIR